MGNLVTVLLLYLGMVAFAIVAGTVLVYGLLYSFLFICKFLGASGRSQIESDNYQGRRVYSFEDKQLYLVAYPYSR